MIQEFSSSNFHELELVAGSQSVRLARKSFLNNPSPADTVAQSPQIEAQLHAEEVNVDKQHSIHAQRVGFFFPEIQRGTRVKVGDLLGQIKAMNINHEVRSDVDGQVDLIGVEEGAGVAFGDLLITLDKL